MRAAFRRHEPRLRQGFLVIAFALALVIFARVVHETYPVQHWLAWRYLKSGAAAAFWLGACASAGYAVVRRVLPRLPLREALAFSTATGVYVFYLAMVLGGLAQLYRYPAFAVGLPVAMALAGARPLARSVRRVLRATARPGFSTRPSGWTLVATVFGVVCIAGIYLTILTPKNAAFDSIWYHLGLGQQWKALGGMQATPEGWFVDALPQLAAVIYAWAFLLPTFDLFDTVELAAHMEFVLFLATLACIPLLVRWLVRRGRVAASWVALFLFPAIFVYDASLSIGNDHIAAFWAVPIFLALRRAFRKLEPRYMLFLALFAAGALLTKYQAAALVAAPAAAIVGRAAWLAVKRSPAPWSRGLVVAAVASLLLTAPHWAKNAAFYGDPLYPALHKHVKGEPWNDDVGSLVEWNYKRLLKRPKSEGLARVDETLRASLTFSFETYARKDFHGDRPIFGSLFTLSLLWLPFLRGSRRTWALFCCAQAGVMVWYSFSHVERYLQPLVPWMAAVVAASIALAWRQGWAARAGAVTIVSFQVLWGADAYFFPTHALMRDAPIRVTAALVAQGYRKQYDQRFEVSPLEPIAKALPPDARLLLHEHNPRLGIGRAVVTDMVGFQGAINYQRLSSVRDLHELYRKLGVTHIVSRPRTSRGLDSLAGDLRFFELAAHWTENVEPSGRFQVARLPASPPSEELPDAVLYLGCGGTYQPGLHRLGDMTVRGADTRRKIPPIEPFRKDRAAIAELVERAGYVIYASACRHPITPADLAGFSHVADRKREQLWIRKPRAVPTTSDAEHQ